MRSQLPKKLQNKKVAIVCDWLTNYAGAERVISAISDIFDDAPIYTSVYNEDAMREFSGRTVIDSFISKLPYAKTKHQLYLNLMPYAFEAMDLDEYDIVISSSHACSKGVITSPSTLHVSYCHSPTRYLWDGSHEYVKNYGWYRWPFKFFIDKSLHNLRKWDFLAAERVDQFVANSEYVASRIDKYYGRKSHVIHPPVDLSGFEVTGDEGQYYIAVGRLIPYKRFDLLVDAFNRLKLPLHIVGDGKMLTELKQKAHSNITFHGFVSEAKLQTLLTDAKALLFPQKEDFGITPLEAMACGVPVIAYSKGGALETVKDKKTGLFFDTQSVDAVIDIVREFEDLNDKQHFDKEAIRKHAETFSTERFKKEFVDYLESLI